MSQVYRLACKFIEDPNKFVNKVSSNIKKMNDERLVKSTTRSALAGLAVTLVTDLGLRVLDRASCTTSIGLGLTVGAVYFVSEAYDFNLFKETKDNLANLKKED